MAGPASVADVLAKLATLHADGYLTDDEFFEQKALLLIDSQRGVITSDELAAADVEVQELEKLANLVRSGVLSPDEFNAQKRAAFYGPVPMATSIGTPRSSVEPSSTDTTPSGAWLAIVGGVLMAVGVFVRGHEKVPTSGQLKGPLVATKSTHWWPGEVPTPH